MKAAFLVAALLFVAPGTYAAAQENSVRAGAADCITTGAALAGGLPEANPLGPLAACALKPVLQEIANHYPEPDRTVILQGQASMYAGAAVNNVAAIAGAGSFAPVFGLMVAVGIWASGADERAFMEQCAIHERLAGHRMRCDWTPTQQAAREAAFSFPRP